MTYQELLKTCFVQDNAFDLLVTDSYLEQQHSYVHDTIDVSDLLRYASSHAGYLGNI